MEALTVIAIQEVVKAPIDSFVMFVLNNVIRSVCCNAERMKPLGMLLKGC